MLSKPMLWRPRSFFIMRYLWLAMLALTLLNSTTGHTQDQNACPPDYLDTCARYQHLAAALDSKDLMVQLAALRAASEELDPALRSLIINKALKSSDFRLRTAGLRYVLSSRNKFNVFVEMPPHPNNAQQDLYQKYSNLSLMDFKVSEKTDEISARVGNSGASGANGSIIRGGFELRWAYCRLRMNAGEESIIRGTLQCQFPNGAPVELPVNIELS